MSFYSEASLAYVASAGAGKDGKAYSMKPVDGTGDFTFSRGSNLAATRVGPTGLIEKGRENLLLQSNQFDTTWLNAGSTRTSGQSGYDGSSDAWLLESANAGQSSINQSVSQSGVQTASVYAKAGTTDWMFLYLVGSPDKNAWFNLGNGTLGNTTGIDSSIESVGNGWYRCSVSYNVTISSIRIYLSDGNSNVSSALGANIYIQDAQIEIGLAATEVISTGATTGKAGLLENEPRFDYSGGATCPSLLLEPSRTQYIPYTEYLEGLNGDAGLNFNYNNATSPEGLTNAVQVVSSNTSQSYVGYFNSPTTAGDNTFSVFAKYDSCQYICIRILSFTGGDDGYYWFDIQNGTKGSKSGSTITYDVEDYGNGWYRCYLVHNVDAGDLTGAARIYLSNSDSSLTSALNQAAHLYGFQWEAGSYSTSYIPNHSGGTITRGEDTTSSNTAVAGATQWTWFFDNTGTETDSAVKIVFQLSGANTSLRYYTTNNGRFFASGYFGEENAIGKLCVKWDGSTLTMFKNGTKSTSTSSTDIGTITQIGSFMSSNGIGAPVNLHQMLFFNDALSDADCITLTT